MHSQYFLTGLGAEIDICAKITLQHAGEGQLQIQTACKNLLYRCIRSTNGVDNKETTWLIISTTKRWC